MAAVPSWLKLAGDRSFSCLLAVRPAELAPECVFEPLAVVVAPRPAFDCTDEFASAAWKVTPKPLANTGAASAAVGVVVDVDETRTPVLLHVACQQIHPDATPILSPTR